MKHNNVDCRTVAGLPVLVTVIDSNWEYGGAKGAANATPSVTHEPPFWLTIVSEPSLTLPEITDALSSALNGNRPSPVRELLLVTDSMRVSVAEGETIDEMPVRLFRSVHDAMAHIYAELGVTKPTLVVA